MSDWPQRKSLPRRQTCLTLTATRQGKQRGKRLIQRNAGSLPEDQPFSRSERRPIMRNSLLVSVIIATLMGTPAIAQQAPQSMMGYGMMNPGQHIEGRLAFLKTELKITDAQAPQWNAYADAMRANAKRMGDMFGDMMSKGMMGPGMMGNQGMMGQGMMGQGMMGQGMMGQGAAGPGMGMMMLGKDGKPMPLPQRMDWMEQHMSAHLEMLEGIKEPATKLYDVLSPEQRAVADQLMMGPMGMM
ncbi:Spy/CpxP family protein refolding chaperone [Dongia sp.]|uniref:Spy/CpxP family protein refolding chaperone n=1 Tax=Dongia sp. TaxID=1977262 RepID=UPI0035AFD621